MAVYSRRLHKYFKSADTMRRAHDGMDSYETYKQYSFAHRQRLSFKEYLSAERVSDNRERRRIGMTER